MHSWTTAGRLVWEQVSDHKPLRGLFLEFIKRQAHPGLQQRDDEPNGSYAIRRARAQWVLDRLSQALEQLERLTIGIDGNKETSQAALEVLLEPRKSSRLATAMKRVSRKRSRFDRVVREGTPASLSISAPVGEREKELCSELLDGAELWLASKMDTRDLGLPLILTEMLTALRDNVREGHADIFLQVYREPEKFSIVAGARLVAGRKIGNGVRHLIEKLTSASDVDFAQLELDAESHKQVSFHRITVRSAEAVRVFGLEASAYLGIDGRTVWLAVGGPNVLRQTKELIDLLDEPEAGDRDRSKRAPFQISVNARHWLGSGPIKDRLDIGVDVFKDGDDRMTIDVRPTRNGMRLRVEVEAGYLRWMGLAAHQALLQRYRNTQRTLLPPPDAK